LKRAGVRAHVDRGMALSAGSLVGDECQSNTSLAGPAAGAIAVTTCSTQSMEREVREDAAAPCIFQELYEDALSRSERLRTRQLEKEQEELHEAKKKQKETSDRLRAQRRRFFRRPHSAGRTPDGFAAHLLRENDFLKRRELWRQHRAAWQQRREVFEDMAECTFGPTLYTDARMRADAEARKERIEAERRCLEEPPDPPNLLRRRCHMKAAKEAARQESAEQRGGERSTRSSSTQPESPPPPPFRTPQPGSPRVESPSAQPRPPPTPPASPPDLLRTAGAIGHDPWYSLLGADDDVGHQLPPPSPPPMASDEEAAALSHCVSPRNNAHMPWRRQLLHTAYTLLSATPTVAVPLVDRGWPAVSPRVFPPHVSAEPPKCQVPHGAVFAVASLPQSPRVECASASVSTPAPTMATTPSLSLHGSISWAPSVRTPRGLASQGPQVPAPCPIANNPSFNSRGCRSAWLHTGSLHVPPATRTPSTCVPPASYGSSSCASSTPRASCSYAPPALGASSSHALPPPHTSSTYAPPGPRASAVPPVAKAAPIQPQDAARSKGVAAIGTPMALVAAASVHTASPVGPASLVDGRIDPVAIRGIAPFACAMQPLPLTARVAPTRTASSAAGRPPHASDLEKGCTTHASQSARASMQLQGQPFRHPQQHYAQEQQMQQQTQQPQQHRGITHRPRTPLEPRQQAPQTQVPRSQEPQPQDDADLPMVVREASGAAVGKHIGADNLADGGHYPIAAATAAANAGTVALAQDGPGAASTMTTPASTPICPSIFSAKVSTPFMDLTNAPSRSSSPADFRGAVKIPVATGVASELPAEASENAKLRRRLVGPPRENAVAV